MLIVSFMMLMRTDKVSYSNWNMELSNVSGKNFSKQGLWKRITPAFTNVLKKLLEKTLQKASLGQTDVRFLGKYNRVFVEDSTCLKLPDSMKRFWKGNHSRGKQKSVAKIHLVQDILSGWFAHLSLEQYSKSEQSLSQKIFNIARQGDLVLRDLGYFVIDNFITLCQRKISFVSRLKYGVKLYDPTTGKEVNISKLLGKKAVTDCKVLMGKEKSCAVRLVAIKLNEDVKNTRIRKAKNDRDKRCNHSKEYYHLLGYVIFITNIDKADWNAKKISQAYRSRWNIEILFKCWKSNFHAQQNIPQTATRKSSVEAILYLTMLFLAWFQLCFTKWILSESNQEISIRKVAAYLISHIELVLEMAFSTSQIKTIIHHCKHESRVKKSNAATLIDDLYYT
jgi:hypothetical protein